MTDYKSEQINQTIQESISEKSILFTDKSTSYIDIADYVEILSQKNQIKKQQQKLYDGCILQLVMQKGIS